ncbi:potassium channel family protein [Xanthomonas floridensis]|uniref:Potassium channel family protein n=1 Tax=Xanthomonas floridensis TaxID=1843580 RepID=A0A1A9MGP5_9XANT|nr:potassium channel family protein [Xanthomonas floridensis]MEA5123505.1 potassium channel family protein [Xanthomonas floridensis]MEA5130371.1 potassium channel family protein [Xanthomonas floridensis]OAG69388.1 potassium channel protein [Xanthomonas floridensis]
MIIVGKLFRVLRRHVRRVSWGVVALALLAHMGLSWVLLLLAGEHKLVGLDAFPYYYMTTATTIGYGDLSPGSVAGRYIAAFVLMPGAVALFATVLAKTSAVLITFWRRHSMGKMAYDALRGHTILIGWQGAASTRLLELLLSDTATDDEGVVLVAEGIAENPMPDHMRFVAAESYTHTEVYQRAGIAGAARVIVNPPSDDQTLAAVFALMAHAPAAHVVAHFDSASAARLVNHHYPAIECTRPMTAEILARAAQDPGSAAITAELLSVDDGPTQFSLAVPADAQVLEYSMLAADFSQRGALLLGLRTPESGLRLNPPAGTPVAAGAMLYYLAEQRVPAHAIAWQTLRTAAGSVSASPRGV